MRFMSSEEIRDHHREIRKRNRETDRRALEAVGLTQGPDPYSDMEWPDVRPLGLGLPESWDVQ